MSSIQGVKEKIVNEIYSTFVTDLDKCQTLADIEATSRSMTQKVVDLIKPDHRVEIVPIPLMPQEILNNIEEVKVDEHLGNQITVWLQKLDDSIA